MGWRACGPWSEKTRASQQLLVEGRAGLYLVERDDDILEEYNVFISEKDSKPRNDARKNIQQLSRSVELMSLVNQREEHFVDRFADHLASGYELNNYAGKWLHLLLRRACARYLQVRPGWVHFFVLVNSCLR